MHLSKLPRNKESAFVTIGRRFISVFVAFVFAGSIGCKTQPHRANQYRSVFETYDAPLQERLIQGRVKLGDSREMVYIALGTPDRQSPLNKSNGEIREHWQYLCLIVDNDQGSLIAPIRTLNDVAWPNPFERNACKLFSVEFKNGTVTSISLKDADSNSNIISGNRDMQLPPLLDLDPQVAPMSETVSAKDTDGPEGLDHTLNIEPAERISVQ